FSLVISVIDESIAGNLGARVEGIVARVADQEEAAEKFVVGIDLVIDAQQALIVIGARRVRRLYAAVGGIGDGHQFQNVLRHRVKQRSWDDAARERLIRRRIVGPGVNGEAGEVSAALRRRRRDAAVDERGGPKAESLIGAEDE